MDVSDAHVALVRIATSSGVEKAATVHRSICRLAKYVPLSKEAYSCNMES